MKPFVHATHPRARPETFTFVSTENFSPSQRTNWWKNNTPREADFVFHTKYSIFWPNFLPVSYQCRFFGITAATFFSKPVISSLPMPHNFGVTRAELPFALYSAIWPTHIIKTPVNAAMYSAIAIGLLVGVTVLSVGVFGAIAYAVASSRQRTRIRNTDTCTQFLHKDFPRVYMSRSGASYYKTYCGWNLIDT